MKALVIALALAMPVPAAAEGVLDWGRCKLYPSKCRPAPAAPVQAPAVAPPPVVAPVAPAPQVTPQAPPVAAPVVVPPRAAPPKRVKTKAVKAAKPVKSVVKKLKPPPKSKWKKAKPGTCNPTGPGPDLPWPCWMVSLNAGKKSCGALKAEGVKRNITLTRKQHCQAAVCIGRCFPS